jgi:hypothetical protein
VFYWKPDIHYNCDKSKMSLEYAGVVPFLVHRVLQLPLVSAQREGGGGGQEKGEENGKVRSRGARVSVLDVLVGAHG